ncbi:winged helix DNA-binding domain-containing protein [Microbacterium radiodurans]|uniref:Winged helix DNA-binding domain-containing protein n=1 Tax=Microbacterium radiodurans TaxID=661398 RepID=A0A5J5INJ6_9MICO|nr:winged helix DNA-binding domain-containing protein [Microbacterium radiodurans]KAA9085017.1 winged helix DNA-binding domain-containing protein [Microbacterium radiodurans]
MLDRSLAAQRMRAHLLSAPAATVTDAAAHMLAVQAQEFWAGRWALATRTEGAPTLGRVDAAFDDGTLVRAWTQRGTLHVVRAVDLPALLAVTAERQERAAAGILRGLAVDDAVLRAAERAARAALAGRARLTRAEFAGVLRAARIDPAGSRGNHILSALALRGVLAFGPVVPRADGPTRDQYLVAVDDLAARPMPADPLAEMFVGYIRSHGPARAEDFRWWAGLPIGIARRAAQAAADSLSEMEPGLFTAAGTPVAGRASETEGVVPPVHALPPFDEYYLSYADRTAVCDPGLAARIGPTANGQVAPVLVAAGRVVGTWRHSVAAGRHHLPPEPVIVADGASPASDIADALARVSRFFSPRNAS